MAIRADDLQHFTVDEYLHFVAAEPDALAHTELVEGVILTVSPESRLHAKAVRHVDELLNELHGGRSERNGSVQLSSTGLWNPDVYVLRANSEDTATFPSVADVEVAVEVCLSTQKRDLGPKLDTYAREGVPVYWAVMPESPGWLVVHRRPVGGTYYSVERIDLGHGYLSIDATLVERYAEPLD